MPGRVTVADRARIANRLVHASMDSPEQAIMALISSDDPWLSSCGAYAIGNLGINTLEGELNRCLEQADPLLRETARTDKQQLAKV